LVIDFEKVHYFKNNVEQDYSIHDNKNLDLIIEIELLAAELFWEVHINQSIFRICDSLGIVYWVNDGQLIH